MRNRDSPLTVQDETIRLKVTCEELMLGIGVEDFDIDKRLSPKETVTIEFTANKLPDSNENCLRETQGDSITPSPMA